MSVDNLIIHASGNNRDVQLGKLGASDLFDFMLPKLQEHVPSFSDRFEGGYYGEVLSISELPAQYFQLVYGFIMQACDELDSLKPHKTTLQTALQLDPRYTR